MKTQVLLAVLLAVICVAHAKKIDTYKDCGSKDAKLTSIEIEPCVKEPCGFTRGGNVTLKYTFTTSKEITSLKNLVYGYIAGIPIPWPLDNPDGCKDCNLKCPLASGGTFTYVKTIAISSAYPKIGVVVKWEGKDQDNVDMVCFTVPIVLV